VQKVRSWRGAFRAAFKKAVRFLTGQIKAVAFVIVKPDALGLTQQKSKVRHKLSKDVDDRLFSSFPFIKVK
jgi:hypothetical protein